MEGTMAKSREQLKNEVRIKHPCWSDFDLENYVNGYYDGIIEYMILMDQTKQGEYDAILEYQKGRKKGMK